MTRPVKGSDSSAMTPPKIFEDPAGACRDTLYFCMLARGESPQPIQSTSVQGPASVPKVADTILSGKYKTGAELIQAMNELYKNGSPQPDQVVEWIAQNQFYDSPEFARVFLRLVEHYYLNRAWRMETHPVGNLLHGMAILKTTLKDRQKFAKIIPQIQRALINILRENPQAKEKHFVYSILSPYLNVLPQSERVLFLQPIDQKIPGAIRKVCEVNTHILPATICQAL